ncbi:MAG: Cof-type HAD-IIB family hydrolase [Lachnospiraceae bacterium]|nr:Cof-type HAD-IIB family hydrolase [Ruminococcus sp.]MCM1275885.1 Cof-type HAD-IIB family hydrolase [Lachnospiraceae bacterium]
MYKLIVLDLDGTLLNSEKKISEGNLAALKRAREDGALIAFSTARSAGAMREYIAAVQPDILISNGGALVERGNDVLFKRQLPAESVRHIIKRCLELSDGKCEITIDTDFGYFWNYKPDCDFSRYETPDNVRHCGFSNFDHPAYKVTAEVERAEDAEKLAAEVPDCGTLSFRGEIWRRFAHIEATKRNALEHICGGLSIEPREILAFGDDMNDLEMLGYCTGVAMGNALPEVKAAAKFVADTNDNDGVAEFLNNIRG